LAVGPGFEKKKEAGSTNSTNSANEDDFGCIALLFALKPKLSLSLFRRNGSCFLERYPLIGRWDDLSGNPRVPIVISADLLFYACQAENDNSSGGIIEIRLFEISSLQNLRCIQLGGFIIPADLFIIENELYCHFNSQVLVYMWGIKNPRLFTHKTLLSKPNYEKNLFSSGYYSCLQSGGSICDEPCFFGITRDRELQFSNANLVVFGNWKSKRTPKYHELPIPSPFKLVVTFVAFSCGKFLLCCPELNKLYVYE